MESVNGIEPSTSVWKTEVLPLNYTDISPLYAGSVKKERTQPPQQEIAVIGEP